MSANEYFLIAEDHTLTNLGYKILLKENFPDSRYKFVNSIDELQKVLDQQGADFTFALWDLHLKDGEVLTLISDTLKKFPQMYMLVVTTNSEEKYARELYNAGIKGYLNKNAREEEMLSAIHTILSGNIYYSKSYRRLMNAGPGSEHTENPFDALSGREKEILHHILNGMRIKEISIATKLNQSTIATYKQRLLDKLHVKTLVDLYQLAAIYKIV